MKKTEQFLRAAFAGESQTNRRYLAFAAKADEEGYSQAARLFRGAALSETVHAHTFLRALKEIKSTKENLKDAVSSETNAFKNRYPEMIAAAKEEGDKETEILFRYALESEKIHARLFKRLLDNFEAPQENYSYYICDGCGHTTEREPAETCPVCGNTGETYKAID